MVIRILTITLVILSFAMCGWCQIEAEWVKGIGEADLVKNNLHEARIIALRNARIDAIEKVCGVSLQAERMSRDFSLAGDFTQASSFGEVIEEEIIEWETLISQPQKDNFPGIRLRVHLNAKVAKSEGERDPAFKIQLEINKSVFQIGDEMIITVRSTINCYLTILNYYDRNKVTVLLPNKRFNENMIEAGQDFVFPSEDDRAEGYRFRLNSECADIIEVIATKERIDFLGDFKTDDGGDVVQTKSMNVNDIARWKSSIPLNFRAEDAKMYSVLQK